MGILGGATHRAGRAAARRLVAGALASASLGVAGCTLLYLPTDLTGGPTPDAATDASTDASPAASDASDAGDAATSAEGGARGPWDASAGPFCSSRSPQPMFCIDYDTSSSIDDKSDFHSVNGFTSGGVSELDTASFTSRPASLHLGVPGGVPGTGNGLTNRIGYKFAVSPKTSTHFECDLRIDATDMKGVSNIVWIDFDGTKSASLALYVSLTETGIAQTPSYSRKHVAPPLQLGTWTHVEIDVAFGPSSATATVALDGVVALDAFALDAVFNGGGGGALSLGPAYYTAASVTATEAHFDNVIVEHH